MTDTSTDNPLLFFKDEVTSNRDDEILDLTEFMDGFFKEPNEDLSTLRNSDLRAEYYRRLEIVTEDTNYLSEIQACDDLFRFSISRIRYLGITPNGKEISLRTETVVTADLLPIDEDKLKVTQFIRNADPMLDRHGIKTMDDLLVFCRFYTYKKYDKNHACYLERNEE